MTGSMSVVTGRWPRHPAAAAARTDPLPASSPDIPKDGRLHATAGRDFRMKITRPGDTR